MPFPLLPRPPPPPSVNDSVFAIVFVGFSYLGDEGCRVRSWRLSGGGCRGLLVAGCFWRKKRRRAIGRARGEGKSIPSRLEKMLERCLELKRLECNSCLSSCQSHHLGEVMRLSLGSEASNASAASATSAASDASDASDATVPE